MLSKQAKLEKSLADSFSGEEGQAVPEVTEREVGNVISSWTKIPLSKVNQSESERLLHMEEELHKRVIGQEEAVKAGLLGRMYPLGVGFPNIKDEIFEVQSNIIRDYAEKSSCIIVGRCAEYVLRDKPNILSVYIYAPYSERLKNCTELLGMDEKDAKRFVNELKSHVLDVSLRGYEQ